MMCMSLSLPNLYPIASRRSPLAMAQTYLVAQELAYAAQSNQGNAQQVSLSKQEIDKSFPILPFVSTGDKNLQGSLADVGGKGLFTKEVEEALLSGEARFAVHSMKDMPVDMPEGLVIAAIPARENPYDAFISEIAKSPWDLPKGAKIGTASVRRRAQILANRPDIHCEVLRGNVNTRLAKLKEGHLDATFLAVSGLKRLGFEHVITKQMDDGTMLPAIGQGALCIQARSDDQEALALAAKISCPVTTLCVTMERAFLRGLDGSCKTPMAGLAVIDKTHDTDDNRKIIFKGEYLLEGSDQNKHQVEEEFIIGKRPIDAKILDEVSTIADRLARQIKQKL